MEKPVATTLANMFSKTTFVFALLALFAVQSSSALQLERVDERSVADLLEKVKELIRKLNDIVNSAIANAVDKLNGLKDKIFAHAHEVIADAKVAIADIVDKVKIQIEHIKEHAEDLGVDVKECIVENQKELEQLPRNIIEKMLECINEQINQLKSIIEGAVRDILSIKDLLVGLPDKLKECVASGKPVRCVGALVAQVIKDITGIPAKIQDSVNAIMELVNNLKETLEKCALSKVFEASEEAAAIGVKVAKCVADKIEA